MTIYQERPATVDAIQWDGQAATAQAIIDWDGTGNVTYDAASGTLTANLPDPSTGGFPAPATVTVGNWLYRHTFINHRPLEGQMDDASFNATYVLPFVPLPA